MSRGAENEVTIFGTDGIRSRSGEGLLAAKELERIVAATVHALGHGPLASGGASASRRRILIARDTRRSGEEILRSIARSFAVLGHPVLDLGVLPTPAVARLAAAWDRVALGVVISASHNPAEYNGIKFFAESGEKVSEDFERAVSRGYHAGVAPPRAPTPASFEDRSGEAFARYVDEIVSLCRRPARLRGRRVALDTAHGAAFRAAPEVFRRLGMEVVVTGNEPDGENINHACGALHAASLARFLLGAGADVGFSFDGDGDRMIPVAASGRVFDGDHVLLVAARRLLAEGRLPRRAVVATSMSNFGLEEALSALGVDLIRTDVGDRYVYREMVRGGHPLGGEQSGHTIFLDDAKTGDGILSALRLLDSLESDALDLEAEAGIMRSYPQVLKNVRVERRLPFEEFPEIGAAVARAEASLAGRGRVLVRYSGTEPLARVMVEGSVPGETEALARTISDAIENALG
jgi:phosphoglucosamine mutase